MAEVTRFDKIQKALFSSPDEARVTLSDKDIEIKERYEKTFTYWLQNPHLDEPQVVRFMINTCGIGRSVAYDDIKRIKLMLGNVKMASKEWYRHMVIDMARQAFKLAKAKNDPKAMAIAADKIGKYMKLDKDEAEALPWEMLIPPNFEPEPDVTILGLDPIDNIEEKRRKLREKYLRKYDPKYIQDAVIVEEDEQPED